MTDTELTLTALGFVEAIVRGDTEGVEAMIPDTDTELARLLGCLAELVHAGVVVLAEHIGVEHDEAYRRIRRRVLEITEGETP